MKVKLTVVQGKPEGRELILPVSPFLIGRGKACHLRPGSETIAEQHCAIVADNGTVSVRDLTGAGGTVVNGKKVQGEVTVETGDLLQVGPLVFAVTLLAPPKPAPATKPAAPARKPAPKQNDDDVDVDDWLGGGSAPAAALAAPAADHVPNPFGDLDETAPAQEPSQQADNPEAEPNQEEQQKAEAKKKSTIQFAATSRAASDILRKYFTRPTE